MKLTVQLKLLPSNEQADVLRQTLERANAAANEASRVAWESGVFRQFALQKLVYRATRERFGLSAQMAIRLIAKVADAYKLDRRTQRSFRPHGSIAYDERILKYGSEAVSIWTIAGRQHIPFVCGEHQRRLLSSLKGESDLLLRDGEWYLYATADIPEAPEGAAVDWIGVDLGVVNIAVDSDGNVYSGGQLNGLRHRQSRLRSRLQSKGTRAARSLLRKRHRKEQRMATHVNHCISKSIVREAERTQRGIVFEDLKGIRSRIRARRSQRRMLHSWAFGQLQSFTAYKARLAGVPVQFVDPRYSSQTCPACGHVARANRPSQSAFSCVSCGFVGLADHIAALNLRARGWAAVNQPDLTSPVQAT